ncbi:hypothetical protein JHK87_027205 [Glycine soja]|nr:hypothetical protein JHK87_027205 [Glycine soja]
MVLTGKGVSDVEKDIGHANGNSVVVVVVAGNGGSKAVKAKFLSSSCSAATSHTTTDDVASLFWEEDTKIISNNVLAEVDKWIERLDRLVIDCKTDQFLGKRNSSLQVDHTKGGFGGDRLWGQLNWIMDFFGIMGCTQFEVGDARFSSL